MIKRFALIVSSVLWIYTAESSDWRRESDYATRLEQGVSREHVVWLTSDDHRFIALWTEAEKADNSNVAIILHDRDEYPDSFPLVHGLRTELPRYDWAALAIQLPLRESGAAAEDYFGLFDEARGRIHAAAEFLRNRGAKNIAVVGVGMGAAMASYTISLDPDGIFAFAAISLPLPNLSLPQAQVGDFIYDIALPFLDVYAEFDLPDVADTARRRRMLAKDNPVYRQVEISGENHSYRLDPERVVKRVYSWLALQAGQNY
ncbi:MAG: DUF3530 family protein [Gammaproteobacteria bacterium]